jgi:DNA replication protein DnaC
MRLRSSVARRAGHAAPLSPGCAAGRRERPDREWYPPFAVRPIRPAPRALLRFQTMAQPSFRCPRCRDRGWIVDLSGEGSGSARRCECGGRGAPERLVERAGVPARYGGCRLDNFRVSAGAGAADQLAAALAVSRRYVEDFVESDGRFRDSGLLFHGPPGTGKTHLAVGVLHALVDAYRVQALFADFTELVHRIQGSFDSSSPESKREILDPVQEAEVLVLDELGAHKPSAWVSDILYLVINHRYARRRPTLFTTNYRLDDERAPGGTSPLDRGADAASSLSHRISGRLVSRLCEMAHPVALEAVGDYRREVRMHQFGA